MIVDGITALLVAAGVAFFVSGTVGLLRFPDVYSRLHALTKCDNLGLGLVVAGLMLRAPSVWQALKMLFVWLMLLVASSTAAHLIARQSARGKAAVAVPGEDRG